MLVTIFGVRGDRTHDDRVQPVGDIFVVLAWRRCLFEIRGLKRLYLSLAPEAWVEINPVDAEQLDVKSGDRLTLSSPRGKVKDVVVKVTQNMAPGQVFVPFRFNEQLINQLTQPLFCPKSGEPNFKQTAVQLHSEKVPQGIKVKEHDIAGEISHEKVTETSREVEVKEKSV